MLDDVAVVRLALARRLVDSPEPVPVALIEHDHTVVDTNKSVPRRLSELRRAAKSLGVETVKVGRVTCWRLPANAARAFIRELRDRRLSGRNPQHLPTRHKPVWDKNNTSACRIAARDGGIASESEQAGGVMLKARLHPKWVGGRDGYRYSVIFEGKLLVERSRDPECDAARALLAMGVTGKLTLLDGKTGRPRLTLDIVKMASLTVREDRGRGPRFVKWKPMPDNAHQTGEGKAYTAETDEAEAWRRTRRRW
jgi:hypothetical protein